ncbi:hypothetical protein E4T47_05038 [Aureobasidium subglaciale]|nr:hypothetical protein E4T47_05038 [Aureobasidium subglaciale]
MPQYLRNPLWSQYADSIILAPNPDPMISSLIQTSIAATYGNVTAPLAFRLGNGGAGYTGILQLLCETFIASLGGGFKIEWVPNHSRHTQIALLGDIVQVALTYEPKIENLAAQEGWAVRVCRVFNDHFILAGPCDDPAAIKSNRSIEEAMARIAHLGSQFLSGSPALFHTRADGSATYSKELELWKSAHVDLHRTLNWRARIPVTPYEALVRAERDGAYLLTDRSTYLTARRNGMLTSTRIFVEGGPELLNPCSALINTKAPSNRVAREFASWLSSDEAQMLVRDFGRDWDTGTPIFCGADREDFGQEQRLVAKL